MISAFVAFLLQSALVAFPLQSRVGGFPAAIRVELRPSMGWSISAWGVVSVCCCSNPSAPPI